MEYAPYNRLPDVTGGKTEWHLSHTAELTPHQPKTEQLLAIQGNGIVVGLELVFFGVTEVLHLYT